MICVVVKAFRVLLVAHIAFALLYLLNDRQDVQLIIASQYIIVVSSYNMQKKAIYERFVQIFE